MKELLLGAGMLCIAVDSAAQSNIVAGGNEASGSGGHITYSIGQVDYKNASSTNNNYNEGVQQPFDVSPTNLLDELNIAISVYPNPNWEDAIIFIEAPTDQLELLLFDASGKLVLSQPILDQETKLSIQELASGPYSLQIRDHITTKTFKLIKY